MVVQRQEGGHVVVGFTGDVMQTKQQIEMIAMLARNISITDLDALIDQLRRAEALGPIFNPTEWMRVMDSAEDHYKLVNAFAKFRRTIEEIAEGGD
jgi:hypothetical protein